MFFNIAIIVTLFMLAFCLMMIVKCDFTLNNRMTIINAIHDYHEWCWKHDASIFKVDYLDMETYERTLYRLYDWGYTRILPKEKFEIVKPFIKK